MEARRSKHSSFLIGRLPRVLSSFRNPRTAPYAKSGIIFYIWLIFLLVVGYFVQVLVPLTTRLPRFFSFFRKPRTAPCATSCIIAYLRAQFSLKYEVFRSSFCPAKSPVGSLLALVRCRSQTRGPVSLGESARNRFFMIFDTF